MSPSTGDRAGEFAKLLNFFDQLVSRGRKSLTALDTPSHATSSPDSRDDTRSSIPTACANARRPIIGLIKANQFEEFYHATTSLKRLDNSTASKTDRGDSAEQSQERDVAASDATESTASDLEQGEDDNRSLWEEDGEEGASLAKFPMEKQRPFTFKLMLHKLYGREDWIKKVQEALEQSKREYKPLSECLDDTRKGRFGEDRDREGTKGVDRGESVRVRFTLGSGRGQAGQTTSGCGRQRSLSVATHSTDEMARETEGKGGIARAVKKRCVGRRKSLNGPLNGSEEVGGAGRVWIYDALISQLENELNSSERGSLRGKGRRRSISVSGGGANDTGAIDGREVCKRTLATVATTILEGTEERGLKRLAMN